MIVFIENMFFRPVTGFNLLKSNFKAFVAMANLVCIMLGKQTEKIDTTIGIMNAIST